MQVFATVFALRQDDASSPRIWSDGGSEGTEEEYHNWPEGSQMHLGSVGLPVQVKRPGLLGACKEHI